MCLRMYHSARKAPQYIQINKCNLRVKDKPDLNKQEQIDKCVSFSQEI
jgi:hypothetical protein